MIVVTIIVVTMIAAKITMIVMTIVVTIGVILGVNLGVILVVKKIIIIIIIIVVKKKTSMYAELVSNSAFLILGVKFSMCNIVIIKHNCLLLFYMILLEEKNCLEFNHHL